MAMRKNICDVIVKSVQKLSESLYIKDVLHNIGNVKIKDTLYNLGDAIITNAYRFMTVNDYDSLTLASIDDIAMFDMDYNET